MLESVNLTKEECAECDDSIFINGIEVPISEAAVETHGTLNIIARDKLGNAMFTRTIDNALLINGGAYLCEKANNHRSIFKPQPLDTLYGNHQMSDIELSDDTLTQEFICGMMFGVGGCTNTYNTVRPVLKNALHVPTPVPIRCVPTDEDLVNTERDRYFLRKTQYINGNEYALYYGKRFDQNPEIKVVLESGDAVPNDISKYDNPGFLYSYTYLKLTISADDIREYFKLTEGNTSMSRINSIGLLTGYPKINDLSNTEFYNVRCITTANTESLELKDSFSTIEIEYLHHIR